MTTENCIYNASQLEFEKLEIAQQIKQDVFGQIDCQVGYCYGHNHSLNSLEWHLCSEINIATTDLILILAKKYNMDENYHLDSKCCKAVFVPKGVAIEIYSDTLHYCPCEVKESGFGMVVALVKGTNTKANDNSEDKKFRAKNKWVITHEENKVALKNNVFAGIFGPNYTIRY